MVVALVVAAAAGPAALVVPVLLGFVEAPVVVVLEVAALAVAVGPAVYLVGVLVVVELTVRYQTIS